MISLRATLLVGQVVTSVIACSSRARTPPPEPTHRPTIGFESPGERRARLRRELLQDFRFSYEHDDSLVFATHVANPGLIDMRVGSARIGVGPGDVRLGGIIDPGSWRRWPLVLPNHLAATVHSKRLRVWLSAADPVEAAWISDEVAWHLPLCGMRASIPLRITALFARAGDQWYEVFEHVSYGRDRLADHAPSTSMLERAATTVADRPLAALLSDDPVRQRQVIAPSPPRGVDAMQPAPTFLLGPRFDSEWHADMDVTRIALGATQTSDGRAALLGKTVAYWVGNLVARRPVAPPTVLRGTFVLEKRCPAAACRWLVVQGHVSRAIDDDELARRVFGSIVASTTPLRFACDELHAVP